MNNEQQEMQIIPTDGIIATSPSVINIDAEEIEDAVVLDDIDPDNHPNFIESNTSAVTLEELTKKCIVPTFADNLATRLSSRALSRPARPSSENLLL